MLPKNRPPTHPGEMLLKEFLEPSGITQLELARHLGWTYARMNEIVNGKRGITAESALALGDALGTGPEFWLNLQRDWNLWHSLKKHKKIPRLKKAVSLEAPAG
jgi:addiction module HigA family antidote